MTEKRNSTLRNRLNSFTYAFNGLRLLFSEEPNSRIHLVCTILVVFAGFFFQISRFEWLAVIASIGFVIAVEIINSAIEALCNHITPELNPNIKKVKDLAAAAVLVSAITACVIGAIIFLPKLIVLCINV